jgi:hypothetical protein
MPRRYQCCPLRLALDLLSAKLAPPSQPLRVQWLRLALDLLSAKLQSPTDHQSSELWLALDLLSAKLCSPLAPLCRLLRLALDLLSAKLNPRPRRCPASCGWRSISYRLKFCDRPRAGNGCCGWRSISYRLNWINSQPVDSKQVGCFLFQIVNKAHGISAVGSVSV